MREKIKSIGNIVSIILFVMIFSVKAYGADFNTSVSSAEATQGETVTVTITFSSDVTIGAYDMSIQYDANILEYKSYQSESGADINGGGGSLRIISSAINSNKDTFTIIFKAKSPGTSAINVVQLGDVCDMNYNDLTVEAGSGSVTVKAQPVASTNNYLSSLQISAVYDNGATSGVTLSPGFSKDVTEYNVSLDAGASRLVVSAAAEDSKSTVTVGGTKLVSGANTATVEVKAENGSVRVYYIYANVKVPETTTQPPTEEPATEEPATEEPATEEPTDAPEDDTRKINISGTEYTVTDVTDEVALPEGFEKSLISWNGTEITGASDLSKTLSLIYVLNEATGEYTFFIYEAEDGGYEPFLTYDITQRTYIMLNVEDDLMYGGSPAYESSSLELVSMMIGSGYVDAYKLKNLQNIYIVRAMDWYNKINYYYYNSDDGSMLPYFDIEADSSNNQQVEAMQQLVSDEHEAYEERINKRNILICAMGIFIVVLLAGGIWVIIKDKGILKKSREDEEQEYEDSEYEDEINTDNEDISNEDGNIEEKAGENNEEEAASEEPGIDRENSMQESIQEVSLANNECEKAEAGAEEAQEESIQETMGEEDIDKAIDDLINKLSK